MRCSYCSTELPARALFCGECGRTVPTVPPPVRPLAAQPLSVPAPPPEPHRTVHLHGAPGLTCDQCSAPLERDDIFCGECGFVSRAVARTFIDERETSAIGVVARPEPAAPERPAVPERRAESEQPPPLAERSSPGSAREPDSERESESDSERESRAERFVLQFSTGESVTVTGSGLIGRNPRPEPGEFVDQLVRVLDPARTVSKTHLEFGQDSGAFWVLDRFSGNGTVLRQPDAAPQRLSPDRRYRLVRGSRVDIGEQFFVVS